VVQRVLDLDLDLSSGAGTREEDLGSALVQCEGERVPPATPQAGYGRADGRLRVDPVGEPYGLTGVATEERMAYGDVRAEVPAEDGDADPRCARRGPDRDVGGLAVPDAGRARA
jgi:hypothetical protein